MLEVVFYQAYPMARRAAQVRAANAFEAKSPTYEDRQDLEQEGLLALWRSLPQFDPTRASIRTFAERVVANQIASVVRAQRAVRRTPTPTDAFAYSYHPGYRAEFRIDVKRVIETLGEGDRRLAWLLAAYSPTEVSRILGKSRSTVYDGIRRIRLAFLDAGIGPSLASYRIPKAHRSGERDTSERIVAQATQTEQIGTCPTLLREVA